MKFYYYVNNEGTRQGPLPLDDLTTEEITPNTLVWCKGMTKWEKAKDVEDFASLLGNATPQEQPASSVPEEIKNPVQEPVEQNSATETSEELEEETGTNEEEPDNSNRKYWIAGGVGGAILLILILCLSGFNKSEGDTLGLDSLLTDTSYETADEELVGQDATIKDFITEMYNIIFNDETQNASEFLTKHCSASFLNSLEKFPDGTINVLVFGERNLYHTKKEGTNGENRIISVEPDGNGGWYLYEFINFGWRGKNRVKCYILDDEVILDGLEYMYDEYDEYDETQMGEPEDVTLSGYILKEGERYPIMLSYTKKGFELSDCVYSNVNLGGKIKMEGHIDGLSMVFEGRDGSNRFEIVVDRDDDVNWNGRTTIGNETFTTHLEVN